MQTILLTIGTTVRVEIKTDLNANIAELTAGKFEGRFTIMQMNGYNDVAKAIIDLEEKAYSFQQLVAVVKTVPTMSMSISDLNDPLISNFSLVEGTDFEALNLALAAAGELVEAEYTAPTWADLEEAVAAGNAVYTNPFSTQQNADDAATAIDDAIAALVAV